MKTQFDGIVKVKKQELDQAEMTLMREREKVRILEDKVAKVFDDILSLEMPQKGTFAQIQQRRQVLDMARAQKNFLDREIESVKEQIRHCQKLYQYANKEFEKMSYLKEQEIAEKMKIIQKQQQKDLDEIALQLFARRSSK